MFSKSVCKNNMAHGHGQAGIKNIPENQNPIKMNKYTKLFNSGTQGVITLALRYRIVSKSK
jgi:hypothetical protein